jgi:hypothetical protein
MTTVERGNKSCQDWAVNCVNWHKQMMLHRDFQQREILSNSGTQPKLGYPRTCCNSQKWEQNRLWSRLVMLSWRSKERPQFLAELQ